MGIGTKIKEILSDEPHGNDQVPGSYPDETSSKERRDYSSAQGNGSAQTAGATGAVPKSQLASNGGAIPGTAAGAAGVAGVAGLGGVGGKSATDRLHKRDDPRGWTDAQDYGTTHGNGGAVGSTAASRGAPAAGATPVYDEMAQPGKGAGYKLPPAPIAFGPNSSGHTTGAGAQQQAGMIQNQTEQSRQAASTSQSSHAGPALAGAGAGLVGGTGAAAGLAHLGRGKETQPSGSNFDDPSGIGNAGLQSQSRGVGEPGVSSGYQGTQATSTTGLGNIAGPQSTTGHGTGYAPASAMGGAAVGGAAPLAARTKGDPNTTGGGQLGNEVPNTGLSDTSTGRTAYPLYSGNQHGQGHSGGALAATGAAGAAGGAGAGLAARGSGPGSGTEAKKDYYGPGHEGAKVVHKCDSCGADNDISRYFNKGTIYRMEA